MDDRGSPSISSDDYATAVDARSRKVLRQATQSRVVDLVRLPVQNVDILRRIVLGDIALGRDRAHGGVLREPHLLDLTDLPDQRQSNRLSGGELHRIRALAGGRRIG